MINHVHTGIPFMKMSAAVLLISVVLLVPCATARGYAAQDAVATFRAEYAQLKSIDVTFISQGVSGRIRAKRGGLYRIEANNRLFISDGKTTWNVQEATKTVVIDTYRSEAEDMSVDRVFFVLMNVYVPKVHRTTPATTIRLSPPHATARVAGVEYADLVMTSAGLISQIIVRESGTTTAWNVTRLQRNPALAASTFSYSPPKGWTVVDLR